MKHSSRRHSVCALALAIAVATLAGCAKNDASSYMASAKSYFAKRDYKAAVVEVKNALQREPENGEARLLLATVLMETGDPAGAEAEVRKAIVAGAPEDRTYPLLARALGAQGEFKKLTAELGDRKLSTPAARVQVALALAGAAAAQGDLRRATNLVNTALGEDPANAQGLLLKATLAARSGNVDEAQALADTVLKNAPNDEEALMIKAQIAVASGDNDAGQRLYEQAIAAHPDAMGARFALVTLAVSTRKFDVAKAQVAKMMEKHANDFRSVYSDALVSYSTGDSAHAHEAIDRVLAGRPDHLPSVFLSGLIDFQRGSNAAAESSLRKVLARAPEDTNAGRVLSMVYLKEGRAADALEVLKPVLQRNPDNAVLLRTAGEAYLATGNTAMAAASYERANAADKTDLGSKVRLAQVRLAAGETARALNDLQTLATSSDPKQVQADLALIAELIRTRQYDKALAAVDALEKKQPKSPLAATLRGGVYLAKRDLVNARKNFDRALELDPGYYSAAFSLAVLDIREGRPEAARARFDKILAKNPKNEQVLLANVELLRLMGGTPQEVKAALDKAVAANPTSVRTRIARINDDMRRRDGPAMVASARAALEAIPNDPQLLDLLGTGQILSGEAIQGVETFKKVVQLQPQNPIAFTRLADAQVAAKDYPGAIESERKALALKPDFTQVSAGLAKIYLLAGRAGDAIEEARRVQKSQPDKVTGYAIEGEVLAAQGKWTEASAAFQAGLAKQPIPALAVGSYVALQRGGKNADATAFAAKWMKQYPKDASMPLVLAEESQRRGNLADAKSGYRKVLDIDPDNATALNNLAWILTEEGDAKGLEYAEAAHRLAPFNPGVLDTLGVAVLKSGDAKRGTALLRMASALSPRQQEIRLHLAKALLASGDKAGARKEIENLGALDAASPLRVEADKLKASL